MKLRVLSYNIHKGFNWHKSALKLSEIRDAIRSVNADLVFLQEVIGENVSLQEKYCAWPSVPQYEFLADQIWDYFSYAKNAVYENGHHGNVILSKFPIISWYKEDISTNSFEKRGILACKIDILAEDRVTLLHNLQLYCVHLNLLHSGRVVQYEKITSRILEDTGKNGQFILAGDFNDWNKKASREFEDKLEMFEAYKKIHKKYPKTFPAQFPVFCLDRIYLHNIGVTFAEVLTGPPWNELSDHAALLIDIDLE